MSVLKRTIIHRDTEYEVCEWVIEELNSIGIEFNDEYITYLLSNAHPCSPLSLTTLTYWDVLNRKHIGVNGLLGRIIALDNKGSIVAYFNSVYDAAIGSLNSSNRYSFEKLHQEGIVLRKSTHIFFGLKINVSCNEKQYEIIKKLNTTIRRCKNKYHDKNKIFKEMYTKEIASRMSYNEYVMQGIRWESFSFAACFGSFVSGHTESKYTKHNIQNCNDYSERIKFLFHKYSFQEECAFKQVYDLNNVKDFSGIYLLCLPQIKGCYVGKTGKCFATRIQQHFTTPNSEFDKKYRPSDIQEIYIMQLGETMPMIDKIEEDCIATLGKGICLNALAGGSSIELIKSDKYDEKNHVLPENLIMWVAEDSIRIANYRKECAEDGVKPSF